MQALRLSGLVWLRLPVRVVLCARADDEVASSVPPILSSGVTAVALGKFSTCVMDTNMGCIRCWVRTLPRPRVQQQEAVSSTKPAASCIHCAG